MTGVRRHAGNARLAASTASPTSFAVESGVVLMCSAVAGLRTAIASVAEEATQWPPTKFRISMLPP